LTLYFTLHLQIVLKTYILHIDTATDLGTVAISCDGVILCFRRNEETRNHAGTINLLINEVLADAGTGMQEISAVAVCAGPGSYTGLRIGVATAKGLCYGLGVPLMLHNRLVLLAYDAHETHENYATQYVSLLQAREKEYYISVHDSNFKCTVEPQHIMYDQLNDLIEKKDTFLVTDVSADIVNGLVVTNLQINSDTNTRLNTWSKYTIHEFECNNIVNLSTAEPFYLKQVYTHK
jgi:tRNA threonylcarbamoyladenosine biosynthesis protein TsaB